MLWRESNSISYILCQYETKSHFYWVLNTISQDKLLLLIIPDTSMYESTEKKLQSKLIPGVTIEFTGIKLGLTCYIIGSKQEVGEPLPSAGLPWQSRLMVPSRAPAIFLEPSKAGIGIIQQWLGVAARLCFSFFLFSQQKDRKGRKPHVSAPIPHGGLRRPVGKPQNHQHSRLKDRRGGKLWIQTSFAKGKVLYQSSEFGKIEPFYLL